jgi:hypothetical protein
VVPAQLNTEIFFSLSVTGLQFLGITYDVTQDSAGYSLRATKGPDIVFMEDAGHTVEEVLACFKKEITQAAIEHMLGYTSRLDSSWAVPLKEQK